MHHPHKLGIRPNKSNLSHINYIADSGKECKQALFSRVIARLVSVSVRKILLQNNIFYEHESQLSEVLFGLTTRELNSVSIHQFTNNDACSLTIG